MTSLNEAANTIPNELFVKKVCGGNSPEKRRSFFEWCADTKRHDNVRFQTKCDTGGKKGCDAEVQFLKRSHPYFEKRNLSVFDNTFTTIVNSSEPSYGEPRAKGRFWFPPPTVAPTTTTVLPPLIPKPNNLTGEDPIAILYSEWCKFGPTKNTPFKKVIDFDKPEAYSYYVRECQKEAYGSGIPIWAIILIILALIASLFIAFTLFYKNWLRRRIYGKRGQFSQSNLSTLESHWTASPVSNVSTLNAPGSGSGPAAPSAGGGPASVAFKGSTLARNSIGGGGGGSLQRHSRSVSGGLKPSALSSNAISVRSTSVSDSEGKRRRQK